MLYLNMGLYTRTQSLGREGKSTGFPGAGVTEVVSWDLDSVPALSP